MLSYLKVTNLGVISEAVVEFEGNMVAITGETGVGKTLVTSAIDLLFGAKASSDVIGQFGDSTAIEGVLEGPDGTDRVIRREISSSGRSRFFLDGALVSTGSVRAFMGAEIEIFGQSLAVSLSSPSFQLGLVDRYGQVDSSELVGLRRTLRLAMSELAELETAIDAKKRDRELRHYELGELTLAKLSTPTEIDDLVMEISVLSKVDEIKSYLSQASMSLGGDQGANAAELSGIARSLVAKAALDQSLVERLDAVTVELGDIHQDLERRLEALEADPERLEAAQRRLSDLQSLERKFQRPLPELIAYYQELSSLDLSSDVASMVEDLKRTISELQQRISELEDSLRRQRSAAAQGLVEECMSHLGSLGLATARLACLVSDHGDGSPVEILFSANPGTALAPLRQAASGGELSRVMLALSLVSGAEATTLIFDEVDAGVGGETALKVGQALQNLGKDRQVIVVTHLAQVAGFADQHLVVEKSTDHYTTTTSVRGLADRSERIVEVARMLSGQRDSSVARDHARELLEMSSRTK